MNTMFKIRFCFKTSLFFLLTLSHIHLPHAQNREKEVIKQHSL